MKVPVRTLSAQDAEAMARTVIKRTASNGRVEYLGQSWYSHALKGWEVKQKAVHKPREVNVRVDELDLSVVYIEIPDRVFGLIKAESTQPEFTNQLSVYELKKLKEASKQKDTISRIGRLSDRDALALRIQYLDELGHKADRAAKRRLSGIRERLDETHSKKPPTAPKTVKTRSDPDKPESSSLPHQPNDIAEHTPAAPTQPTPSTIQPPKPSKEVNTQPTARKLRRIHIDRNKNVKSSY